jgi:hypothetical protein
MVCLLLLRSLRRQPMCLLSVFLLLPYSALQLLPNIHKTSFADGAYSTRMVRFHF